MYGLAFMTEKASKSNPVQPNALARLESVSAERGPRLRLTPAGHEAALQTSYEDFISTLESEGCLPGAAPSGRVHFATVDDERLGCAGDPADPPVVSWIREEGRERLLLHLTPGHPCFAGHFDGEPILAGVVQLHWAALIAGRLLGGNRVPTRVYRLKFRHIATPPRLVEARLDLANAPRVAFRFYSHPHPHAQGVLEFDGMP